MIKTVLFVFVSLLLIPQFSDAAFEAKLGPPIKTFDQAWRERYGYTPATSPTTSSQASSVAFNLLLQQANQQVASNLGRIDAMFNDVNNILGEYRSRLAAFTAETENRLRVGTRLAYWQTLNRLPSQAEEEYWIYEFPITSSLDDMKKKIAAFHGKPAATTQAATSDKISPADRKAPDFIQNKAVPVTVERIFNDVFGRKPNTQESAYWKVRARSDKARELTLRGAMQFQKTRGKTMPVIKKQR